MAQSSNPPAELSNNEMYQAAVRRYEGRDEPTPRRHEELVPSGSFLADDIIPTNVRPSAPTMGEAANTLVDAEPLADEPEITVTPAAEPAPAPADSLAQTTAKPPARSTTRLTAVLLVLLAAAVAAAAVYFLLPLFT
jgi:hypothetical protein